MTKGKNAATAIKSTKKAKLHAVSHSGRKGSRLNLMVQVNEPKNLRKDILEGLREIIIFMQGYETFRKIQEEKVKTFAQLRDDVKVLNSLIDTKLRRYLPKGKLAGMVKKPMPKREIPEKQEREMPKEQPARSMPGPVKEEASELDELEVQLREIEGRLKNI